MMSGRLMRLALLVVVLGACAGEADPVTFTWQIETAEGVVLLESDGTEAAPLAAGTPLETVVSLDGTVQDGSPIPILWTDGSPPEPSFVVDTVTLAQCFQIEEAVDRLDDQLADGSGNDAQRAIAYATRQALEDWGAESEC